MSPRDRNDLPPPSVDDELSAEAARIVADWPLLAMLTAGRSGAMVPRDAAEPAVAAEAAPIFIPPAPPAAALPEASPAAEAEPAPTPLPEPTEPLAAMVTASPEAEPAPRQPNQLEQLFNRADKNDQGRPPKRTVFKQSGPPPLKTPGSPDTARGLGGAVTIEPRPRQWHELETVPDRLFDRAGGH